MSRPMLPREDAIGVECAWPVRELGVVELAASVPAAKVRRRRWQSVVATLAVGLLVAGGWSLRGSAIDTGAAVPSVGPAQNE